MSKKIKEIKQLTDTGYVSTPIGCDAENVDLSDGMTLEEYAASVEEHIEDNISHITSKDRTNWDSKLDSAGDSQDNTTTFTSNDNASPTAWTDVDALTSGEKHSSIFSKISTMFKNIRWLYKMLGTTDISSMGNGTVTGALSQLNTDLYANMGFIPNYTYFDLPPDRTESGKRTRLVIADGFILSQIWNDSGIERSIDITGYQSQNLDGCFLVPISASDLSFVEKTGLEANLKLNVRFSSDIPAGTTIMTLPEWYRPWLDSRFAGVALSADGTIYIVTMHLSPDGNIKTDSKISSEDSIFMNTTYIWKN